MTPARRLLGSALVAASTIVALSGLRVLLAPGRWWVLSVVAVVALTAATALARRAGRGPAGTALLGLVATTASVLLLAAGAQTTSPWPGLLGELARQGVDSVVTGVVPVPVTPGLEILVVLGAAGALLLCDLLALGLGRAGLAGLPLAGLWSVPISFGFPPPAGLVVLGGTGYLLLLAVTAEPAVAGRGRARVGPREAAAVVAAATLATLALLGGPLATATPVSGTVRLPAAWGGVDTGPTTLSTDLDLTDSLSARSDRTVLVYTTAARDVGPLRTRTLLDFDGTRWDVGRPGELDLADGLLWPTERAETEPVATVRIRVGALDENRLPLPTGPRSVDVGASWWYDAVRDEVVGLGSSTLGLTYAVRLFPRDLSAEALTADAPAVLPAEAPELAVPASEHAQDIADLAREVTAGEVSAYDRAMALQTWFRNAGTFTYNTRIPPAETDDAVWDFLVRRSGYCVQYATAMTVMARTLGIPSRVAIGFLPGRPSGSDPDTFVVTSRQAHAWPELWFEDAGWVRFEPTPAVQTGAPPPYADPFLVAPTATPTPTASTQSSAPTATAAPTAAPGATGGEDAESTQPWLVLAALAAALLGLVGWLVVRRRREARTVGPEESWAALRTAVARHGVRWSDATTPRQAAEEIRAGWPAGASADDRAEQALVQLLATVERARYAPLEGTWSADELDRWVIEVTRPWVSDRSGDAPSAPRGG